MRLLFDRHRPRMASQAKSPATRAGLIDNILQVMQCIISRSIAGQILAVGRRRQTAGTGASGHPESVGTQLTEQFGTDVDRSTCLASCSTYL